MVVPSFVVRRRIGGLYFEFTIPLQIVRALGQLIELSAAVLMLNFHALGATKLAFRRLNSLLMWGLYLQTSAKSLQWKSNIISL
jgi:hypothetical protein